MKPLDVRSTIEVREKHKGQHNAGPVSGVLLAPLANSNGGSRYHD